MSGQSIQDRIQAARHSIAGQGLAKAVCKATTEEVMGPKKKHLDCKFVWVVHDMHSLKRMCTFGCQFIEFYEWNTIFWMLFLSCLTWGSGRDLFVYLGDRCDRPVLWWASCQILSTANTSSHSHVIDLLFNILSCLKLDWYIEKTHSVFTKSTTKTHHNLKKKEFLPPVACFLAFFIFPFA